MIKKFLALSLLVLSNQLLAEDVSISHKGITLNANLEKSDDWPNGPTMLVTHGTLFHNKSELMVATQELLLERGISSLAINLGLNIDNRGGAPYDCKIPHTHKHSDSLDEIDSWSQWLKSQGVSKVSVLGHSRGGAQTAWYAAERDSDMLDKVVLVAPMSWDMQDEIKDYKRRYNKDLMPLLDKARQLVKAGKGDEQLSPVDFIYCEQTSAAASSIVSYYEDDNHRDTSTMLSIVKKPVQVFIGTDDKLVVGLEDRLTPLVEKGTVELHVIDGSDHFFRDLYAEDMADMISEFLQPDA